MARQLPPEQFADHYGNRAVQTLARTEDYPPVNQYGVQLRSNLPPEYWRQSPNHNPHVRPIGNGQWVHTEDTEEEEYDAPPVKRTPSSVRKYNKPSNTALAPAPQTQEQKKSRPYLLYLALFVLVMLFGYAAITALAGWVQGKMDDLTYGYPRTFKIYQNVGHSGQESLFIATNDQGEITVIEKQKGHPEHTRSYTIMVLPADQANVPITLSFQDINGDGLPDMLVHYGESELPMYNNGTGFQSQPPQPKK